MKLKLFSLDSTKDFAKKVADILDAPVCKHEEKFFHDKEAYVASLENVRGCDVFVMSSLYSDNKESVNDKIMKLMIFIGSLRDASAARVTAVMPYYPYARQDRKTSSRAPITTKYLAKMLESVGTNRLLTIDAHNPTAIQNAFKINVDLLEANIMFARHMSYGAKGHVGPRGIAIMSPDTGGMGRARKFRSAFQKLSGIPTTIACLDKTHEGDNIQGHGIIGSVEGRTVIVIDDMISSGKTISEVSKAAKAHGAIYISGVCATHGLFVGNANQFLEDDFVQSIFVTDTIEPFRITNGAVKDKLEVLSCTDLFAEAIKRTHKSESISDLFSVDGGY